jgi:hypothetical protein
MNKTKAYRMGYNDAIKGIKPRQSNLYYMEGYEYGKDTIDAFLGE